MLHLTGGTLVGILLAGCGFEGSGSEEPAEGGVEHTRGIVFNTASKDVTLFDPATNEVTDTRPTSAVVRWLSNQQRYWDGDSIWTYDFPDNELQAIAIDPQTFEVTKQVPVDGAGPGHSFVLSPDNGRGFVPDMACGGWKICAPGPPGSASSSARCQRCSQSSPPRTPDLRPSRCRFRAKWSSLSPGHTRQDGASGAAKCAVLARHR